MTVFHPEYWTAQRLRIPIIAVAALFLLTLISAGYASVMSGRVDRSFLRSVESRITQDGTNDLTDWLKDEVSRVKVGPELVLVATWDGQVIASIPEKWRGTRVAVQKVRPDQPFAAVETPVIHSLVSQPYRFLPETVDLAGISWRFSWPRSPDGTRYVVGVAQPRPSLWGVSAVRWNADLEKAALALFMLLDLLLAFWVFLDARERKLPAAGLGLLVLFTSVVGASVYLLVRGRDLRCPRCEQRVRDSYLACPHCGNLLSPLCSRCGRPVEEEWDYCVQCAAPLHEGGESEPA